MANIWAAFIKGPLMRPSASFSRRGVALVGVVAAAKHWLAPKAAPALARPTPTWANRRARRPKDTLGRAPPP